MYQNWKLNTLFSKLRKLNSLGERTWFLYFLRKLCFFHTLNDKIHNYVLFAIIVRFNIQKLKNKQTLIQTEKAKSSHFDRTRGDNNQKFPTWASLNEHCDVQNSNRDHSSYLQWLWVLVAVVSSRYVSFIIFMTRSTIRPKNLRPLEINRFIKSNSYLGNKNKILKLVQNDDDNSYIYFTVEWFLILI